MIRSADVFRELNPMDGRHAGQFFLWIDAVGGYWVCLDDEVTLGQPVAGQRLDVPILGDLSSRHARIRRDGEGYLIEAVHHVAIDGHAVRGVAALADGSRIRLGNSVELAFRRPHALSATARLDFTSPHRTQPSTDAVLLMADSCVLGPKPTSHVVCPEWPHEVVLYRHENRLYCRGAGPMEIDGAKRENRGPITLGSRVAGDRFAFSLEAM